MHDINVICDYVIFRIKSEDEDASLNNLKLQKLLYYIQAWHLAFYSKPLFRGKFAAWIHGPVNREIYDRFKDHKSLYAEINIEDIIDKYFDHILDDNAKKHVDVILEHYAKYSGTQLEYMTHNEDPWLNARKGHSPIERCEKEIDEDLIRDFYKNRLAEA